MDIIFLHNLRIDAVIGVWEWERRIRQTLQLDIDLGVDTERASRTDDIADTIDYKAVADRIMSFTRDSEFNLIEALADTIARIVLDEFEVKWIRVRINKQGVVRQVRDVGVIIERGERQ